MKCTVRNENGKDVIECRKFSITAFQWLNVDELVEWYKIVISKTGPKGSSVAVCSIHLWSDEWLPLLLSAKKHGEIDDAAITMLGRRAVDMGHQYHLAAKLFLNID